MLYRPIGATSLVTCLDAKLSISSKITPMSFDVQTADVLTVNDDGTVSGPASLVQDLWFGQASAKADHRFTATTSTDQVRRMLPEGGWLVGRGGRTRQRMRKVANELKADGWQTALSGHDDGTSLLSVMPPAE